MVLWEKEEAHRKNATAAGCEWQANPLYCASQGENPRLQDIQRQWQGDIPQN
jgi:hypothetical protein